jgi:hypothetical protein
VFTAAVYSLYSRLVRSTFVVVVVVELLLHNRGLVSGVQRTEQSSGGSYDEGRGDQDTRAAAECVLQERGVAERHGRRGQGVRVWSMLARGKQAWNEAPPDETDASEALRWPVLAALVYNLCDLRVLLGVD